MRCLLIGNFGVGNLGDEALKEFFLEEFSDCDWTVLSAAPSAQHEVARLPGGIRSLLSLKWIATLRVYRKADTIVFGGGSLFTDAESVYACFLWWLHAVVGRMLGTKIHFAFQGIGPFNNPLARWFTRSALRGAESISARDRYSCERVVSMGLSTKVVQSFDPVFSLFKNKNIEVRPQNILILIPRKNSSVKFSEAAQNVAKSKEWEAIKILSMQPGDNSELEYCKNLAETLNGDLVKVAEIDQLLFEVSASAHVVSERYHGALAAIALQKEVTIVSQKDEDKLSSLVGTDASELGSKVEEGIELLKMALN